MLRTVAVVLAVTLYAVFALVYLFLIYSHNVSYNEIKIESAAGEASASFARSVEA